MKRGPLKTNKIKGGVYNGTGRRRKHSSNNLKKQKQKEKRAMKMEKQRLLATKELLMREERMLSSNAPRVAVIGGGAAGLASLRYLLASGCNATLFERDHHVGGLWQYRPKVPKRMSSRLEGEALMRAVEALPTGLDIPPDERVLRFKGRDELAHSIKLTEIVPDPISSSGSIRHHLATREAARRRKAVEGTRSEDREPLVGPMYEHLRCNLPKEIMSYFDLKFPLTSTRASTASFINHYDVVQYLHHYTQHHDLAPHIHTNTTVLDAVPLYDSHIADADATADAKEIMKWQIDTRNNKTNVHTRHTFDWLVVANGHYSIPDKKPIQTIENLQYYPGIIMHSVVFDDIESFLNLNVIVVGAKASGTDIAHAISRTASNVYVCDRHFPYAAATDGGGDDGDSGGGGGGGHVAVAVSEGRVVARVRRPSPPATASAHD